MLPAHNFSGNTPHDNPNALREKMHLENQLRTKRNEGNEKERMIHEYEREITVLQGAVHHDDMEYKRIENEVRTLTHELQNKQGTSQSTEQGLREKDQALARKRDTIGKLEQEIESLKRTMEGKQREIAEHKEEMRGLMQEKEEFRRRHELEHAGAQSESAHKHDKEIALRTLTQSKQRKEDEIARKERERDRLKHDLLTLHQDISSMEAKLARL